MESLQHFKKQWTHNHDPLKTLLEAVQAIKPTVLIATLGVGQTFTQEVVEAMTSFNKVELEIFSNMGVLVGMQGYKHNTKLLPGENKIGVEQILEKNLFKTLLCSSSPLELLLSSCCFTLFYLTASKANHGIKLFSYRLEIH